MAVFGIAPASTSAIGKYCVTMPANRSPVRPTWDVASDPETESTYECLSCGTRVIDTSHPGACPECGASLRNCATSIE